MPTDKMLEALNGQINAELWSSYLYLSMSASLEQLNLSGFANWMRAQAQEEVAHAIKIFDYVNQGGGRAVLRQIEEPPSEWDSPLAAFEHTYRHEQTVTGLINDLVNLAATEGDDATSTFLQWFVAEQVEEEASADEVLQKLKLVAGAPDGLLALDRELGQRAFTMPPATAGGEAD